MDLETFIALCLLRTGWFPTGLNNRNKAQDQGCFAFPVLSRWLPHLCPLCYSSCFPTSKDQTSLAAHDYIAVYNDAILGSSLSYASKPPPHLHPQLEKPHTLAQACKPKGLAKQSIFPRLCRAVRWFQNLNIHMIIPNSCIILTISLYGYYVLRW